MSAHSPHPVSARRGLIAGSVGLALAMTLAACIGQPDPAPAGSPPPSESASPTPQPSVEPGGGGIPIGLSCDELINPEVIYTFNPNFGLVGEWIPDAGSAAAEALDEQGVACRWVNQTSGETIDVSVARLDEATLTRLKNDAFTGSTMVPTYGEEAYFEVENGVGTAIVFDRDYWLVATSEFFLEPGEPTDLVAAALGALP